MKIKLLKKHKKDCRSEKHFKEGFWNTAWAYPKKMIWKSSKCDNRGNGHMWHVLVCNDPDCPAQVAISNEAICELVDKSLRWERQEKLLKLLRNVK